MDPVRGEGGGFNPCFCPGNEGCSTEVKTIIAAGAVMVVLGITLASLNIINPTGASALIGIGTPLLGLGAVIGAHQMDCDEEQKWRIMMCAAGILLIGSIAALSINHLPPWAEMSGRVGIAVATGLIIYSVVGWAHEKEAREAGAAANRPLFE